MCTVIVHSGPRPRSALAVDAYVSVPVRMVLAKTDVKILPAVSCLCVHAARSLAGGARITLGTHAQRGLQYLVCPCVCLCVYAYSGTTGYEAAYK